MKILMMAQRRRSVPPALRLQMAETLGQLRIARRQLALVDQEAPPTEGTTREMLGILRRRLTVAMALWQVVAENAAALSQAQAALLRRDSTALAADLTEVLTDPAISVSEPHLYETIRCAATSILGLVPLLDVEDDDSR